MAPKMALARADIEAWIAASQAQLDVMVCPRAELPGEVRVIGAAEIERDMRLAFSDKMGAFAAHRAQHVLQRVAARVARRLGQAQTGALGVAPAGLQLTWFHPVLSELATLVPLRHLARHYLRQGRDTVYAIEMPSQSFTALNAWNTNSVAPFYLAYALRRAGVQVFLYHAADFKDPRLSFGLSDRWLRKGYPRLFRDRDFNTVFCKIAVRRPELVSAQTGAARVHRPGFLARISGAGFGKGHRFHIMLRAGDVCADRPTYGMVDAPPLDAAFVRLLGPLTREVAAWYQKALAGKPVQQAHLADHASFEGGLLAAEALKRGGEIHLWPHSANVVHIDAHDPAGIAKVTVAARSTGRHWARKVGADKVVLAPDAILPQTAQVPEFDPGQPLNIVLFAGAHFLQHVPLLSYGGHTQSWTRTLQVLHQADLRFVVKHKSVWETRDWVKAHAGARPDLQFSTVHANKLRLPNMVFMSVSMTSTAILEGIARGIPGLVVRDVPIDETPCYDPEFVPRLTSDELGAYLAGLASKSAWEDLRARQGAWFRQETGAA